MEGEGGSEAWWTTPLSRRWRSLTLISSDALPVSPLTDVISRFQGDAAAKTSRSNFTNVLTSLISSRSSRLAASQRGIIQI